MAAVPAPYRPTPAIMPVVRGPDPYLGTVVADRYRINRKLGEGGMGVVYSAHHVVLEKPVAIKILADDLARRSDLVQRFLHEAKAASRIHQENIVDITDFGQTQSGTVFFVMELLEGRDLATLIRREVGPLPWPRAKPILVQICRALAAAHQKGIIHRDMKPENVFLVERGSHADFAKVLDFGIAKMTGMEEGAGSRLTRTGMIFGTPEYMSPEQAQGTHPDHRVDIYAVGVIMFEMLTGQVPFRSDTFMGVLTKHMFEAPVAPSERRPDLGITPDLDAIVLRALEKDRDRRFPSMVELGQAIAATEGGVPMAFGTGGRLVTRPGAEAAVMPAPLAGSAPIQAVPTAAGMGPGVATPLVTEGPLTAHGVAVAALGARTDGSLVVPRSRAGLWIALVTAVVVIGGGIGGYAFLWHPAARVAPPAVDAGAPVAPTGPRRAEDEPRRQPIAAPMVDAAPRTVELAVRSRPAGAEVLRGTEKLGVTPLKLALPAGSEEVVLTLRKAGFEDHPWRVTPERDREVELELKPVLKRRGGKPRPVPAKRPEKDPQDKVPDLKNPFADG
jgi:serine/threonine-protein kinase